MITIDRDCPLAKLSPGERESLVTAIAENGGFRDEVRPYDIYYLLLVLYGTRPSCILSNVFQSETTDAAEVLAHTPPEYLGHGIPQFLNEFDIPYIYKVSFAEVDDGRQLALNYYISYDSPRRARLDNVLADCFLMDLTDRKKHVALGRFLGYPEDVIQAWCDTDHPERSLFNELPRDELRETIPELNIPNEIVEADPVGFLRYIHPYAVPPEARDCKERVLKDAERFLTDGFRIAGGG